MIEETFLSSLRDVSITLPELPEVLAFETLERIEYYERELILPGNVQERNPCVADYGEGSAEYDDEIKVFGEDKHGLLVSADHATDPVRVKTGVREAADHGTGAIGLLLSQDQEVTAIVPIGRQTGNASVTPDYPLKDEINQLLPDRRGYLSIHGMRPGKVLSYEDKTEIHGLIGLGSEPDVKSLVFAENLVGILGDIGLRVVVSNTVRHMERDSYTGKIRRDELGLPVLGRLAALKQNTSTNHAKRVLRNTNNKQVPIFQIELTRGLRLVPEDFAGWNPDRSARAFGVYAGVLLCRSAVEYALSGNFAI